MGEIGWMGSVAAAFAGLTIAAHVVSTLLALRRCRAATTPSVHADSLPPVSIIRPAHGVDPFDEVTLRSTFRLDHPRFEVLFCVQRADDPAVPLIRRLIGEHPDVPARLLVGDDRSTANPKLNNVIKGWQAARHDWIAIADSNVLMPGDYLARLLGAWRSDTGLVCSPPAGSHASGFWAELECAFLNTYQARWQYAADSSGLGFAQGKSMLWRRELLDRAGGIRALAREIAEDAAATKIVRDRGLRVRLVDGPFAQPIGRRRARQVWDRQLRWARLRRATFPLYFAPELMTGAVPSLLAVGVVADAAGLDPVAAVSTIAIAWYGLEAWLARSAGWQLTPLSPVAWLVRDASLPLLWLQAWLGNEFVWRGNVMSVALPDEPERVH
ncbi:MAG: ceramide glucosyltransferase [Pseudomonadota bacterium]